MSIEDWEDARDQAGARRGRAWHGMAWQGRMAWHCVEGQGEARQGKARQDIACE